MNNSSSILEIKDYSKISFHVKEIMDSKNMTRSKLSKLANVRFEVADKWYNGNIERMDIDVLTRICLFWIATFPI
ncbi:MAG: helix-turn-helix transcriptional regulator [Lachnospiraceae bacterium]|uniref:helix-turn-helix domain-containing protein n=1 Tax=Anaerotignum sp. MB30-C6 TaxID=3070814 RepID=UPI0027DE1985|nr:helix-turn-helix transcriptional regulator [Anaerotignum sp. MB30-C6]MDD3137842.1 helix-turn-helix transcriptional regulator [Lachnospiraceae bacterium]WMI82553.1 helix-turn-helix transcriptional regulator [Anaerotignum sp. MB30-C6]